MLDRLPHNHGTYREISVDHFVPHSCEFFPGDVGVPVDNLHRDFLYRFPDNNKIEDDRLAGFPVAEQLLVCHAVRVG